MSELRELIESPASSVWIVRGTCQSSGSSRCTSGNPSATTGLLCTIILRVPESMRSTSVETSMGYINSKECDIYQPLYPAYGGLVSLSPGQHFLSPSSSPYDGGLYPILSYGPRFPRWQTRFHPFCWSDGGPDLVRIQRRHRNHAAHTKPTRAKGPAMVVEVDRVSCGRETG